VSKALSLCKSIVEFSESTEKVECERILLIGSKCDLSSLNIATMTVIDNFIFSAKTNGNSERSSSAEN
jgi:hypothetical protein